MLRLSFFCLLAGVAVVTSIDRRALEKVKPRQPFTDNRNLVLHAVERLTEFLVDKQPDVNDPKFHYLLTLGVTRVLAEKLENSNLPVEDLYKAALKHDLPELYRDLVLASKVLKENMTTVTTALKLYDELAKKFCRDLDAKDCDKVLEYELQNTNPPEVHFLQRSVNVLEKAAAVAETYLKLQEELAQSAKARASFNYLLTNRDAVFTLAKQHAEVLTALDDETL